MPISNGNKILRTAFAVEAVLNILGGLAMLIWPSQLLTWALQGTSSHPNAQQARLAAATSHPASWTPGPSPSSMQLLQWLGALVLGLTPQLLLALPSAPQAPAMRRIVYCTLLAGEVALVPTLLWQAWVVRHSGVAIMAGDVLTVRTLLLAVLNLMPLALWRAWCLVWRPAWFTETGFDTSGSIATVVESRDKRMLSSNRKKE